MQWPKFFWFDLPGTSTFLTLKIFQYGGSRQWVQLFWRYFYKKWYKNWYIYFHKAFKHQIWQAGRSKGIDLYETNQAGAGHLVTSRSLHFENILKIPFSKGCDHQILTKWLWRENSQVKTKVIWSFHYVVLRYQVTNLKHIFTTKEAIATKFGRMLTYLDGLLLIK